VDPRPTMRADKWLWHARFFKTRGLATKLVSGGHLRVNSQHVSKPSHAIGAGDVLTFPQARQVRVIRVVALSQRRGPATEAQALYEDQQPTPARQSDTAPPVVREGNARPTKRDRRAIEKLLGL